MSEEIKSWGDIDAPREQGVHDVTYLHDVMKKSLIASSSWMVTLNRRNSSGCRITHLCPARFREDVEAIIAGLPAKDVFRIYAPDEYDAYLEDDAEDWDNELRRRVRAARFNAIAFGVTPDNEGGIVP